MFLNAIYIFSIARRKLPAYEKCPAFQLIKISNFLQLFLCHFVAVLDLDPRKCVIINFIFFFTFSDSILPQRVPDLQEGRGCEGQVKKLFFINILSYRVPFNINIKSLDFFIFLWVIFALPGSGFRIRIR